ncbi:hypothetical protein SAY87_028202 [Trapa incisa]|uniref:Uncharacterized protein n=1 Tax=Trapa incisa TaxID=236973 RepID=A0AAN7KZD6_9MYRT|nr:hypothetical protein SAY87_028202 [Trapa incisa]
MIGLELVTDRTMKTPAKAETMHVMEQMKENGNLAEETQEEDFLEQHWDWHKGDKDMYAYLAEVSELDAQLGTPKSRSTMRYAPVSVKIDTPLALPLLRPFDSRRGKIEGTAPPLYSLYTGTALAGGSGIHPLYIDGAFERRPVHEGILALISLHPIVRLVKEKRLKPDRMDKAVRAETLTLTNTFPPAGGSLRLP